jgi:MFS family permease
MTSDREFAQVTSRQQINHAVLPFIVAATFFMEYLDTTVIATALPQMAKSFRIGPNEVSLGMTAYMLTLAVFIPVSGWISGRFGSRTVFGGATVIFTLASVACGFSAASRPCPIFHRCCSSLVLVFHPSIPASCCSQPRAAISG